jgi:hypothetical protein
MSGVLAGLIGSFAPVATSYESIASASPNGASTVSFSSIPSTYKHLQIRYIAKTNTTSTSAQDLRVSFNDDGGNPSFTYHYLRGNGTTVAANGYYDTGYATLVEGAAGGTATASAVGVIDIIDYQSSSKNKTVRSFFGEDQNGSGFVNLSSGLWRSTNAITKITIQPDVNTFAAGTTIALYGIKG